MTLPAMPALTDPVLIEKAARLLAPAQSVPSSVSSDTPAGTGGTGRGGAEALPARFRSKFIVVESGCWLWQAGRNSNGYGRYSVKNRYRLAHRFAYELLVAPIPEGLDIDHLCRTRTCVNPSHMEPVKRRENTRRGDNHVAQQIAATHCPKGHPLSGDNLRIKVDGSRCCRECQRDRSQQYRERHRDEIAARKRAARAAAKNALTTQASAPFGVARSMTKAPTKPPASAAKAGRVAPQSEKQPTPTRSRRGRSERPVVPGRKAG